MKSLYIKGGLNLRIAGQPAKEVETLGRPSQVAVLPDRTPGVKPRMKVKAGDPVKIGSLLYEDKRNPAIKFRSPGGGMVVSITYGTRRIIREIVIELAAEEEQESFSVIESGRIDQVSRPELINAIADGGLWSLIRALPFRAVAEPDNIPPAIIVSLNGAEPFQPLPEIYLQDSLDLFRTGINLLNRLSPKVYVFSSGNDATVLGLLNNYVTHTVSGDYPAGDPAVFLYHIKQSSEENRAWYIDGQDLLLIARLITTGKYPLTRVIASGGNLTHPPNHLIARIGAPLAQLVGAIPQAESLRSIVGGVFTGYKSSLNSFMGLGDSAVTMLPEGDPKTLFGFVRPGYAKPSRSRAFLSVFNKAEMRFDCSLHGEERACINCGSCARVCPVDILPQFTMKCLKAEEIEEALLHGLLDCAECGVCTYVCPSKINLANTFKNAKAAYYKELNG